MDRARRIPPAPKTRAPIAPRLPTDGLRPVQHLEFVDDGVYTDLEITHGRLANAAARRVTFERVVLRDTDLAHVRLERCVLADASLQHVVLRGCTAALVSLRFARLRHSRLEDCALTDAACAARLSTISGFARPI